MGPVPLVIMLVGILGVAFSIIYTVHAADTQTSLDATAQEKREIEEPAKDVADETLALCAREDRVARALHDAGVCRAATDVRRATDRQPVEVAAPPEAIPPSPAQIRAAVADYLRDHPPPGGRAPTASEVAAAVAEYLGANPPSPGREPTPTEIANAVADFCSAEACVGPRGVPGPGPTDEQIANAIASYCAQSNNCQDPNDPDPVDDPDPDDPEIQDPEIQDPEIDDPDPPDYCPQGYTRQDRTQLNGETWLVCVRD